MAAPKRPGSLKRKVKRPKTPEPAGYANQAKIDPEEPLRNPQHEAFAQCVASGMSVKDAYIEAGFKLGSTGSYGNARRLNSLESVRFRVASIQKQRASADTAKFIAKAERLDITRERVLEEYAAVAFARITQIVDFSKEGVSVKGSDTLDDATVAAIGEVAETINKFGTAIRVKLHDKLTALAALSKLMGFTSGDGTSTDKSVNPGAGAPVEITDEQRAIALLSIIERVKRTRINP